MELLESVNTKKRKPNIKKEVLKYLRNWYWILLSVLLFYIAAKIYLRYTENQYLSKTTLQFPQSKSKGNTALSDLQTLGTGLTGSSELQSETTAIIAKPLLAKVVQNLNLNVSFFGVGKILELELYTTSPLQCTIVELSNPDFTSASYTITPVGKNGGKLSDGSLGGNSGSFTFGKDMQLPFGKVRFNLKEGSSFHSPIKVVFRNTKTMVSFLERSVSVTLPENKGLLMDLSLTGTVPKKSEDILNEISKQYNEETIKDRNEEAQNTQDFINGRLVVITEDLSGIENEKEGFKKSNQITDLDAQANLALTGATDAVKQILNYQIQLDLVNSVFNATSGDRLIPSNMGLSTATDAYINRYNDLLLQRNKTLKQATELNPSVIELNKEVGEIKGLIRKNLLESRETLQLQIAQVQGQLNADRSKISKYPTQEKVFRSIERQQNLKEQLYLYLLQKREENAITLAVNSPKAKVLNPAYTVGVVKPDRQQITFGALLAGLLLPVLILYGKFALNTKVISKEDVLAHISNATVIAEIPIHEEEKTMVSPSDFTVFAESFRILTSNLKFILKSKKAGQSSGVILVTSSVKGEGKTTIAMNTALTLAGSSKVLIIGADIRNPQLQRFTKETKKGLTDFLVSEDDVPDSYIVPSELSKNMDILFSGAMAPNPNDLLDMPKFDEMISFLKKKYQYIVLDSAPVMLVSDTLHLIENADTIVYVVKSDFTENGMLDFADEFQQTNAIKKMTFVLNNVKPENTRYGNKYGYGYYTHDAKKGLKKLDKIFSKK